MLELSNNAAIVIIGNEILSGKIADENGPYLVKELRGRGIEVREIRIVADEVETIAATIRQLAAMTEYVFTTGGIGPTHDDVTIAGVASAFNVAVVRAPELEEPLRAHFGAAVTDAHLKMAEVPEGSQVLLSPGSVVPTVVIRNVTVLPGVPSLMKACFERVAGNLSAPRFCSRAVFLAAFESEIAEQLNAVQQRFPQVAIGSYPRFDDADHRVRVTMDGRNAQAVQAAFEALQQALDPSIIVRMESSDP